MDLPRDEGMLRKVPKYNTPAYDELETEEVRRRPKKHSVFTRGAGMDMPLLFLILILLAVGLVTLFTSSFAYSYYYYGDSFSIILRQVGFAAVGIVLMLAISFFDYHHFHKLSLLIYVVTIIMLIAVLVMALFNRDEVESGGATRWLTLGPIKFQPSEVGKFALIVMFAHLISQRREEMRTFSSGFLPLLIVLAPLAALIIFEKHVSATIIIVMIALIMMVIGGVRWRYIIGLLALVGVAIVLLLLFSDMFAYAMPRVQGWLDPFNPPEGVDTYQTRQSILTIASGELLGVGVGQSRQKHLYLPELQNDFVFAVFCEEMGFVGALIVIIIFALFIWRAVYVSSRAKDRFGMLLGLGISFQVGIQIVLNLCVVTNTIPNTGISLPFFSSGGTALVMLLIEMGVLLQVSRGANLSK